MFTTPGCAAGGVVHTIIWRSRIWAATKLTSPNRHNVFRGSVEKTSNGPPWMVTEVPPRVGPPVGSLT